MKQMHAGRLTLVLLVGWILSTIPERAAANACSGDCDNDTTVGVNELVVAVNIALGTATIDRCASVDDDRDSNVSVSELVRAVGYALNGCASPLIRSGLSSLLLTLDAVRALDDVVNPALSVGRVHPSPYRCRSLTDSRTEPAPAPPPTAVCFGFGSASSTCDVGDVVSRFVTVYENCRSYDPFTDNNLLRIGTAETVMMDLGTCDTDLSGPVRQYTADFLDHVTDPFNRTVERIEQRGVLLAFDESGDGCAQTSMLQGSGTIEIERPCLSESRSYSYENLVRACDMSVESLHGSLGITELIDGTEVDVTLDHLTIAISDNRSTVEALLSTSESGSVTIGTVSPLTIAFGSRCPTAGTLALRLSNTMQANLSFRDDGSVEIDLTGDDTVDETLDNCRF